MRGPDWIGSEGSGKDWIGKDRKGVEGSGVEWKQAASLRRGFFK